jgi:hypothetical protein
MSLTFTRPNINATFTDFGNFRGTILDVTLDSSYPSGGYSISPAKVGFKQIYGAKVLGYRGPSSAILGNLEWDYLNGKLLALAAGGSAGSPSLVVEEVVTMTSNAGRLSRVPGYIIGVQSIAGSVTGAFRVIPTGKTPTTTMAAVNFVTGAIATLSTDAVTSLLVTYIPLGVGNFTAANRVVDEAVVWGSGAGETFDLANRAAVIQYIWNDTASGASRLPAIQPVGESPATNEITIDINNAGATTITDNAAQDTNTGLATYFKYDATWLSNHQWTDDADITITSTSLFSVADDLPVPPQGIWIPGFGVIIVGEATTTNKNARIQGPRGVAGANVAVYNVIGGNMALTAGDGYTTFSVPYIFLNSDQNAPAAGQVQTGANLSSLIARIMFYGL